MTEARLPVTKIHELRHIGISLLLDDGVDPSLVAQIAGHSNANITRRFYAHVLDGRAYAAAETLTFFGSKSAGQTAAGTPRKSPGNGIVSTQAQSSENERETTAERCRSGLTGRS
jgi:hypothetical protein